MARTDVVLVLGMTSTGGVREYCKVIARGYPQVSWNAIVGSPPECVELLQEDKTLPQSEKRGIADILKKIRMTRRHLAIRPRAIIHAHTLKGGLIGALSTLGSTPKVRMVYTPHSLRFSHEIRTVPRLIYLLIERFIHWRATSVTYLCADERSLAKRAGLPVSKKGVVINTTLPLRAFLGHDSAIRRTPVEQTSKMIAMCGSVDERKDYRFFLSVAKEVCDNDPTVHFVWIGSGPGENDFRDRVKALGVEKRVSLMGQLTRPEVAAILRSASVFLFTSRAEGVPLAVIEAQTAGCLVVSSEFSGYKEVIPTEAYGKTFKLGELHDAVVKLKSALEEPIDSEARAWVAQSVYETRGNLEEFWSRWTGVYGLSK